VNVEIRKSFEKDAEKLPPFSKPVLERIIQNIIIAKKLSELPSCKKLTGFKTAYRIRFGNYRIGFFFENDTIELVRILNRKDIYKYFP
jgi:mRNA interferase RelE/StbE